MAKSKSILNEDVNDVGLFKVIFMAGGSGSGKDFVAKKILGGLPLKEINSDTAFAYLLKKNKLDLTMPDSQARERNVLRDKAKEITSEKLKLAFDNRLGLIINGTGDDPDKIKMLKDEFENRGYDTSMLFVQVPDSVSKQRNLERGLRGGRSVPEEIRAEKWKQSNEAMSQYRKMFGDNFNIVDNSLDEKKEIVNNNPGFAEEKLKRDEQFDSVFNKMKHFLSGPSKYEAARQWYEERAKLRKLDAKRIISHQFAKGKYEPFYRKERPVISNDPRVDYERLSNASLAQRNRWGDKKAGEILKMRNEKETSKLAA